MPLHICAPWFSGGTERLNLAYWMERYQEDDPDAPFLLVRAISPALLRYFRNSAGREHADDLLQETWLRIHRARHSYRRGETVLPWVYSIARRVRVDGYRRLRRVNFHETLVDVLPEPPAGAETPAMRFSFDSLVATLPDAQREVITLLKARGLSLEEVASVTSCSVGAVKQKAHRAYRHLRTVLQVQAGDGTCSR